MFGWINNKTEERLTIQAQEQLKAFLKRRLDKLNIVRAENIIWSLTYSFSLLIEMAIPVSRENAYIVRAELAAQFRSHFSDWNYSIEESQYENLEEYKALRKSLNGDKYAVWEITRRAEKSINNDKVTREKTVALLRNQEKIPTGFKLVGFLDKEEIKFLTPHRFAIADFLEKIYADFDSSLDAYRSFPDCEVQDVTDANASTSQSEDVTQKEGGDQVKYSPQGESDLQGETNKQEMAIQYPGTTEQVQRAVEIKKGYKRSSGLKEYIVNNSHEIQKLLELIQKNPELEWFLQHQEEVRQLMKKSEEIGFEEYAREILEDVDEILQLCILLRRFEPSESS